MALGRRKDRQEADRGRRVLEARALLEQEVSEQARFEAAAAVKTVELEDLQRRVSADIVAAGDGGDALATRVAQDVAALRLSIDAYTAEARARQSRVQDVRRQVVLAEAADLREEATRLLAEAAERQVRTDELLALLREHEHADYMPWRMEHHAFEQALREHGVAQAPHVPASEKLRVEAARLQREADRLEASVRIPQAVPTVQLSTEETRDPSKLWQTTHDGPLVQTVVHAHVTEGQGGPHEFGLLVDGEERETVTLAAGIGERLVVGLGVPPLEKAVEVVATIDGRHAARITVGVDGGVLPGATAGPVLLDGAALPADDGAAVLEAAFAGEG